MMRVFLILASLSVALAGCDNDCSGHGICGDSTKDQSKRGQCICYPGWGLGEEADSLPGDCSSRVCEYSWAWADGPTSTGLRHSYTECGGKGHCNRDSGECECFEGYEGSACQRSACANDCSGHGRCQFIEDFGFGVSSNDNLGDVIDIMNQGYVTTYAYYGWDRGMTRGCLCDPEWGDFDCSKRLCPYGNDPMDAREDLDSAPKAETQSIYFQSYDNRVDINTANDAKWDKTFALSFKTKLNETFTTHPIRYLKQRTSGYADCRDMVLDIEYALQSLPSRPIDEVKVACHCEGETAHGYSAPYHTQCNVTFTGERVQGNQNLLMIHTQECSSGCTPLISGMDLQANVAKVKDEENSDLNSWECSNRGKCDYETGVCNCYEHYFGHNCNNNLKIM